MIAVWHWILHVTGTDDTTDNWYGFFSGFGSILERLIELVVIGGILLRHHNCHEPRCWRLGKHPVEGTPFKACRKHHPAIDGKPTKGHMTRAWYHARSEANN